MLLIIDLKANLSVFKTVEGQSVLGGFNSFPLRQFALFDYI